TRSSWSPNCRGAKFAPDPELPGNLLRFPSVMMPTMLAPPVFRPRAMLALGVMLMTLGTTSRGEAQPSPAEIARGKYVFGATGGCGCHTEKGAAKPINAGGRRFDGPFGTVYSTNITPDRQTGIGGWTDEQIITATRLGRRPNGERLIPVHP